MVDVFRLRPVDAGLENLTNPEVTFGAGRLHVVGMDRRELVGRGQLTVSGVTVGAGCRNYEAALQQALAVNAVDIALDDVGDVGFDADGGLLSGTVTFGAQPRHVLGKGRREWVGLSQRVVIVVTGETTRGVGVSRRQAQKTGAARPR